MTSHQEKKNNITSYFDLKSLITILGIIGFGLFWIFTINGIPSRVTTLETKVEMLERSIIKNETQTELILNAIYEIRNNIQNITLQVNNKKGK